MTTVVGPSQAARLSAPAQLLAGLLPGVYAARDQAVGGNPLSMLLEVLAAPLAELESAVGQLLDDHFVERAAPEALPLIADLVGARLLGDDTRTNRGVVARTVAWRRRKGTAATLAEVLRVTSGWDAEIDEAFRSLLQTQDLRHPVPWRGLVAVVTDPIAVADPLSRRAPAGALPRRPAEPSRLARLPGEDVEQTLARIGRADAGHPAASPRTVDLLGWARPNRVVVATERIDTVELERVEIGVRRDVVLRDDPAPAFAGLVLDPGGGDQPLAGRTPLVPPDTFAELTDLHEPAAARPPAGFTHRMLTPTALALDPAAAVAADSLSVFVDDVRIAGADPVPGAGEPLPVQPIGPQPLVRFADDTRPGPAEEWTVHLVAAGDPATVGDLVAADPSGDVTAANPALVRSVIRRGGRDPEQETPAARVPRAGATVFLRLTRSGTATGHRRRPATGWQQFTLGERRGEPVSDAAVVTSGGTRLVVRLELLAGALQLASWRPDSAASRWTSRALDLTGLAPGDQPELGTGDVDGPRLSVLGLASGSLMVTGPAADGSLGAWRLPDPLAASPVLARADTQGRRPPARWLPALAERDGRLLVFGGHDGGRVLGDLWSIGADDHWTPHLVRNRQARTGGRLLVVPDGVVLLGGAAQPGSLEVTVWHADLTRARPAWEPRASLPVDPGRPGVAWARVLPGTARLEVLAWPDRTAPVRLEYDDAAGRWTAGPPEPEAPNPPAEGEGLFVDDEFTVVGPPPLPPAEVLFRLGGQGRIAFLPAVDLAGAGQVRLAAVRDDGSTDRWFSAGEAARPSLRLGAGREAPVDRRIAPAARIGVPGRLSWAPLQVRQLSLGRWETPLTAAAGAALDGRIGVDPRLGRVLVPRAVAGGQAMASFRVARASALGAGFSGPLPAAWLPAPGPEAPDRLAAPPGAGQVTAWVSPRQAGVTGGDGVPVVDGLGSGLDAALGGTASLGVLGSPRLPAQTLSAAQGQLVSVWPADPGGLPYLLADPASGTGPAVSLTLLEHAGAAGTAGTADDPDRGPVWFGTGLTTAGAVDLVIGAGDLELRWCTLAGPGQLSLVVAGAGHEPPLLRLTLPQPRVRVTLFGCRVGRVELPPWARLTAAGCTFDAGDRDSPAIAAAGAAVDLRHCTVHGQTLAGSLAASSCVFTGTVSCDRPDLGWVRHSVLVPGGRPPAAYRTVRQRPSLSALAPAHPLHLALAPNNPPGVLAAGELGRTPGAHWGLAARLRELTERADDFVPLALVPHHVDAAGADLERLR